MRFLIALAALLALRPDAALAGDTWTTPNSSLSAGGSIDRAPMWGADSFFNSPAECNNCIACFGVPSSSPAGDGRCRILPGETVTSMAAPIYLPPGRSIASVDSKITFQIIRNGNVMASKTVDAPVDTYWNHPNDCGWYLTSNIDFFMPRPGPAASDVDPGSHSMSHSNYTSGLGYAIHDVWTFTSSNRWAFRMEWVITITDQLGATYQAYFTGTANGNIGFVRY